MCLSNLIDSLQKCRKNRNLLYAKQLHDSILNMGMGAYQAVGNYMVPMFVDCGSVLDAQQVFDRITYHNELSWTSLILGYINYGQMQHALDLYQRMQDDKILPSSYTLVGVLRACTLLQDVERGQRIHVEIVQRGLHTDNFVGNTLVSLYAKCGLLAEALQAFDKLPLRTVVSWTALITGYTECGCGEEALECFKRLKQEYILPNSVTFASILKACGTVGVIDAGQEMHTLIIQMGLETNTQIGNSLVSMYSKFGALLDARQVFDRLHDRDIISWTAIITAYSEHGPEKEALCLFRQMQETDALLDAVIFVCALKACCTLGTLDEGQEIHAVVAHDGFEHDVHIGNSLIGLYAKCATLSEAREVLDELQDRNIVSWASLIAGYAEHGPFYEGLKCLEEMQADGICTNNVIFACVLKMCGGIGHLEKGRLLQAEIYLKGFEEDILIGSALVDTYAKCGFLLEAQALFDRLPVRNVVSWTALIGGYTEHEFSQQAVENFDKMKLQSVSPNTVTFSCVLKACSNIGAIDKGQELHMEITEKGLDGDSLIDNSLISMYMKCGSLINAQDVFDKLPVQNVVAWSSMIKGYGLNHESELAIKCFEKMQGQRVMPNAITFTCLLTACCQASLTSKGQEYFEMMNEKYRISPTVEHYTCMIDLFARSGCLYEAEKFFKMASLDCEKTWATLLSACKTYGRLDLADLCFQQLVEMNSDDAAWYVLMAEMYASPSIRNHPSGVKLMNKH